MKQYEIEMRSEIEKLVKKFDNLSKSQLNSMTEEETKKDFILPLFRALGWDVENSKTQNEVSAEENISRKRVDYGFRIAGIPKFFVEAKSFSAGVARDDQAFQAINYAYNKNCTWAILTDFKTIRLFNAETKTKQSLSTQFFSLECSNFLKEFDQLILLSKPCMIENQLDKIAASKGRIIKKEPIDLQLLDDMMNYRKLLEEDIRFNDKKLSKIEIEESAQKILDRLIFIRATEDREIEEYHLKPLFINSEKFLWKKLIDIFKKYANNYGTSFFEQHLCDQISIGDNAIEETLRGLYSTKDGIVHYDFNAIDTDILGSMYEQYLGYSAKGLTKIKSKRKEHGIYYTPKYVVDYIVKNTVGIINEKNPEKIKKIKIFDPASGSGSFLTSALKYLISLDADIDVREKLKTDLYGSGSLSTERLVKLQKSIFGVDLDQKAVEITKLNLFLQVLDKQEKLPYIKQNIKFGNSLITKKQFSKDYVDWESYFPQVFHISIGGFDVVIGNPPYFNLQTIHDDDYKNGLQDEFSEIFTGQNDILYFFYSLGFNILNDGGYLGFITSRYFLEAHFALKLRTFLKENTELIQIIDFGSKVRIFQEASINTCILIFKKKKNIDQNNIIQFVKVKDWKLDNLALFDYIQKNISKTINSEEIEIFQKSQKELSHDKWSFQTGEVDSIMRQMQKNAVSLGDLDNSDGVCQVFKSLESGLDKTKINGTETGVFRVTKDEINQKKLEKTILKPLIKNGMIRRYQINYNNEFLIFTDDTSDINKFPNVKKHLSKYKTELEDRYDFKKGNFPYWRLSNLRNISSILSKNDKLFVPMVAPENRFVFIHSNDFICTADVYVCILKDKTFNLRYVQGILNSELMNYVVKRQSKAMDGSAKTSSGKSKNRFSYAANQIKVLPIKKIPLKDQQILARLVEEIEDLYKKLNALSNQNTSMGDRIKDEISIINSKIDKFVYATYDILPDEAKKNLM